MPIDDLMRGLDELEDNQQKYHDGEQYFMGTTPEYFASARLARALLATGTQFRVRMAKVPVDAVANRLEIEAVTVTDSDELTNMVQNEVWDANNLLLESPAIHRKTAMFGDSYVIVWPGEEEGSVQVFYNSPYNVRVIYEEEDPQKKAFAIKCWDQDSDSNTETGLKRANLYYDDVIEKWVTKVGSKGDKEADWVEWEDDEDASWPVENPYGQVPVFHFRNDRPYGTPEHEAAYGPQDAINKIVTTQMGTIDYHGFPQRYALTDPNVESDEAADFGDDDLEAEDITGGTSSLKAGPGELWWLQGVKAAGQFAVADPNAFLLPLDRYIRMMATVTETPLHLFDPQGDVPSGESLRTAEAPLIKKVINRQQHLAATWSEVFEFSVKVLTGKDVAGLVDVRWAPPASIDDRDSWQTAQLKLTVGVPLHQVLLEQGYTEDQVEEWEREREQRQREMEAKMKMAPDDERDTEQEKQPEQKPEEAPRDAA